MRPDIDGNDLLVVDQKYEGQPVAEGDGNGVEALAFTLRCVDTQRGTEGVGFNEKQALFGVTQEFRVLFEELPRQPDIALREDDLGVCVLQVMYSPFNFATGDSCRNLDYKQIIEENNCFMSVVVRQVLPPVERMIIPTNIR